MAGNQNLNSTQEHLPIAGIQDGIVIMNDSSLRVVLKAEPVNFELKSENEQDAIIYSYQSFLNSLDFSVQIIVQSKKLDLERYLTKMEDKIKQTESELLRIQIEDYVGFVRRLISVANIMSKKFFVVVSYSPLSKEGMLSQFNPLGHSHPTGPVFDQDSFDRYKNETFNRASIIANGLARIGVKSRALDTQELIELFYTIYNPEVATEERLAGIEELSQGVIQSPEATELAADQLVSPVPTPTDTPVPSPEVATTPGPPLDTVVSTAESDLTAIDPSTKNPA